MSNNSLGQDIVLFPRGKLLNVDEVAQILDVSPSTVRGWVFEKKIPFVKFGIGKKSLVKFNPGRLNTWIEKNSREPGTLIKNSEIEKPQKLVKFSKNNVNRFSQFIDELKT